MQFTARVGACGGPLRSSALQHLPEKAKYNKVRVSKKYPIFQAFRVRALLGFHIIWCFGTFKLIALIGAIGCCVNCVVYFRYRRTTQAFYWCLCGGFVASIVKCQHDNSKGGDLGIPCAHSS